MMGAWVCFGCAKLAVWAGGQTTGDERLWVDDGRQVAGGWEATGLGGMDGWMGGSVGGRTVCVFGREERRGAPDIHSVI